MLLQLLWHPLNHFYMLFAFAFYINRDVMKVYYHKNIKLFGQNLINIALKHSRCSDQSKRDDSILEMTIMGLES